MKVKKKEKEQTNIEKRNTAISMFALATILPLLLTLFVGFRMGQTREVNEDNFNERYNLLEEEKDALEKKVTSLNDVLVRGDSLLEKFKNKDVENLIKGLDQCKDQVHFNDWDVDKRKIIKNFKEYELQKKVDVLEFEEDKRMETIHRLGMKWLEEYADAKDKELFIRKIKKVQGEGAEATQELEDKIRELEGELLLKSAEILKLETLAAQKQGAAEIAIETSGGGKNEAEKKLTELQGKASNISGEIIGELELIRSEILPSLKGQGFLRIRNNEEQVRILKDKLKDRLNAIERHTLGLKN